MAIKEILAGRGSNINPITPIGRPTRSVYSRMADTIQTPNSMLGLMGSTGNWVTGLTNAFRSGLGFYGAKKDYEAEKAYNEQLAAQAAQERQDKLAQQAWEQEYKERALAQDLEKAQLSIAADNRRAEIARGYALEDADRRRAQELADAELKRKQAIEDRNAQYAHEQSIYDRNRANAIADRDAQLQAAIDAENRKQAHDLHLEEQKRQNTINDMIAKGLRPEEAQKFLNNPQGYDAYSRGWYNPARWFGPKNTIVERKQPNFSNVSNEDLLKGL